MNTVNHMHAIAVYRNIHAIAVYRLFVKFQHDIRIAFHNFPFWGERKKQGVNQDMAERRPTVQTE